ncbi:MAG: hypothetical protein Q7R58_01405 [bacterium]|nr:hypothetical protein [bacterium]
MKIEFSKISHREFRHFLFEELNNLYVPGLNGAEGPCGFKGTREEYILESFLSQKILIEGFGEMIPVSLNEGYVLTEEGGSWKKAHAVPNCLEFLPEHVYMEEDVSYHLYETGVAFPQAQEVLAVMDLYPEFGGRLAGGIKMGGGAEWVAFRDAREGYPRWREAAVIRIPSPFADMEFKDELLGFEHELEEAIFR